MNFYLFFISLAASTISANLLVFASGDDAPEAMLNFFLGGIAGWIIISLLKVRKIKKLIILINLAIISCFLFLLYRPSIEVDKTHLLFTYALPSFLLIISAALRITIVPIVLSGKSLASASRIIPAVILISLPLSALLLSAELISLSAKIIILQIISLITFSAIQLNTQPDKNITGTIDNIRMDNMHDRLGIATLGILLFSSIGMTLSVSGNISSEELGYEAIIMTYFFLMFIGVFIPFGGLFKNQLVFIMFLSSPLAILLTIQSMNLAFYSELVLLFLSAIISGMLIPLVQDRIISIEEVNLRKIISSDYSLIRFTIPAVSGYLMKTVL